MGSNSTIWKLRQTNNRIKTDCLRTDCSTNHPLEGVFERQVKQNETTKSTSKHLTKLTLDPLSLVFDGPDPLQNLKLNTDVQNSIKVTNDLNTNEYNAVHWTSVSNTFTSKFTTRQKFLIASNAMPSSDVDISKLQLDTLTHAKGLSGAERIKARLAQFDETSALSTTDGNFTQDQFVKYLCELKNEMEHAWNAEQRVKALKIALHCIKLLGLSSPEMFYPHKFILVTDTINLLADLVLKRLTDRSQSSDKFMENQNESLETARNWFFKVSSIRELLPRLYMEAALLPCFSLIQTQRYETVYGRLIEMCRGIGDPIVSAFVRLYIVYKSQKLLPKNVNLVYTAIQDTILSMKWGWSGDRLDSFEHSSAENLSSREVCERVFGAPLHWLSIALVTKASQQQFMSLLKECEGSQGLCQYLLLLSFLKTFPHSFLVQHCIPISKLIAMCHMQGINGHEMLLCLGLALVECPPSKKAGKALLEDVWLILCQFDDINVFLETVLPWLQFAVANFNNIVIEKLMKEILKKANSCYTSSTEVFYRNILKVIQTVLRSVQDEEFISCSINLHGLLRLLQKGVSGGGGATSAGVVPYCSSALVLSAIESINTYHVTNLMHNSLIQLIIALGVSICDSINALTTEDEKRQISHELICFIRKVDFGNDVESQLQFYVEARASFSDLDLVLADLVQCVCALSIHTLRVRSYQHSSKTSSFVHACSAYCFITIPSLTLAFQRAKLYSLCAATAALNSCMGQGDACMIAAINEIPNMINDAELTVHDDVCSLVSTVSAQLVCYPDPPYKKKLFFLFQGLVNALFVLRESSPQLFVTLSCLVLRGLAAASQKCLLYHIRGVDANIDLCENYEVMEKEANEICNYVFVTAIHDLQVSCKDRPREENAYNLCSIALLWCDLKQPELAQALVPLRTSVARHCDRLKIKDPLMEIYKQRP